MSAEAKKKTGGLAGIVAGQTAIATVGKEGVGLTYRGYSIDDLALKGTFEETAYLLLHGALPTESQLSAFQDRLIGLRAIPQPVKDCLERIPASANPMEVLRTGCSMLGCIEPESTFDQQIEISERMLAVFPSLLLYWYRFSHDGKRIETSLAAPSLAGHFLEMLHDKEPDELARRAFDSSLTLYAEHEFNASTFTARVCAATLSDIYSAITGAIGTLRGPLHGGANEAAMVLIERFESPEDADSGIREMLVKKELIMGFGHRVYKTCDPRSDIIKEWARQLAEARSDKRLYEISEKIESIMWDEKKLFPNLDFFAASAYHLMGVPTSLFTPIFVCSRVTGWCAHVMEQRSNNRLIRPGADYIGPDQLSFVPIGDR